MIKFFARHPTAANLLMLTLLLLGLVSLSQLKRETFPEFSPPYILAGVVYPGASPQEVEESICIRMEDAVDGLGNIEETKCEAIEGSVRLIIKLNEKAISDECWWMYKLKLTQLMTFQKRLNRQLFKNLIGTNLWWMWRLPQIPHGQN